MIEVSSTPDTNIIIIMGKDSLVLERWEAKRLIKLLEAIVGKELDNNTIAALNAYEESKRPRNDMGQ